VAWFYKGADMNKRCEYKDGLGYRCGSYAFNLYKEKIDQGDRCDRHYWQDQAMKAAAQERERIAKWYATEGHMMFPVAIPDVIRGMV
jgi:hypothetical protein